MGNSLAVSTCFHVQKQSLQDESLLVDQKAPINAIDGEPDRAVRFSEFLTLHLQNPESLEAEGAQKLNFWELQSPYFTARDGGGRARDESLDNFLSSLDDCAKDIPQNEPISPGPKNKLSASKSPRRSKAKKSPHPKMSSMKEQLEETLTAGSPVARISNPTFSPKLSTSTKGLEIVFTDEFDPPAKPPKSLPPFSPAVQQPRATSQTSSDNRVAKKDQKKKKKKPKTFSSLFGKLVNAIK